jgi:hypothetical protein
VHGRRASQQAGIPKGAKSPVDKALGALVADGAISAAEKTEIVQLIDYRNVVAHQMHYVFADVSPTMIARDVVAFSPDRLQYNYDALKRLRYFEKLFDGLYRTHHYIRSSVQSHLVSCGGEDVLKQNRSPQQNNIAFDGSAARCDQATQQ